MKKIAVLLATYNGSARIEYLLNSLVCQTYTSFNVYVHDDASTDNTLSIIEKYKNGQKGNLTISILNDICKRGAKGSFMWLLENVESDYYMFCDQDDFWLPFKIEQSVQLIERLEKENFNKPICVHTDLAVADTNYNIIATSLWTQSRVIPKILEHKDFIQVFNCVTGCSMIFNRLAKKCALPMNPLAPMHDFWVAYQVLANNGILTHLPSSTILYCQHGNNVVGANKVGLQYVLNKFRLKKLFKKNVETYKLMHQLSNISWLKYFGFKLYFEIRRFF
ncbi:MAG: glycosyltransferase [Bacteroidales bacterium]|nr:glycosyltransferase [Bacteroidales bacterium]